MDELHFTLAMGADEAIEEQAQNRYAEKPAASAATIPATAHVKTATTSSRPSPAPLVSPHSLAQSTKQQAMACSTREELETAIRGFKGLSITKTATNTVFADGVPTAEIMLIGEAPGAEEDAQGIPFCGPSGQMLDQMLSYIGLSRPKNFYITNTIFWRPPGNRRPTPEELAVCQPFVEKHIALIAPKLIILVGGTAVTSVLGSAEGITKLRGKFFNYSNPFLEQPIPTTAIFHPSYLLRSPGQKRVAWQDALMIREYIEKKGIRV